MRSPFSLSMGRASCQLASLSFDTHLDPGIAILIALNQPLKTKIDERGRFGEQFTRHTALGLSDVNGEGQQQSARSCSVQGLSGSAGPAESGGWGGAWSHLRGKVWSMIRSMVIDLDVRRNAPACRDRHQPAGRAEDRSPATTVFRTFFDRDKT